MTDENTSALIEEAASGDADAFALLVEGHIRHVYAFAYRLTGNAHDAEDATQETFIKAWKHLKKFDMKRNFKTWLLAIARNTAIDGLRKRRPKNFSELGDTDAEERFEDALAADELLPDEIFERAELRVSIESALAELPLDQRSVIVLKYIDGLTFEEIAEVTSKPMNTVKSHYRRGLTTLKKILLNAPK